MNCVQVFSYLYQAIGVNRFLKAAVKKRKKQHSHVSSVEIELFDRLLIPIEVGEILRFFVSTKRGYSCHWFSSVSQDTVKIRLESDVF